MLEPVLLKLVVTVGGISKIRLGDNNVEYDPNFRLYISTKMANPHYPPELCVKVSPPTYQVAIVLKSTNSICRNIIKSDITCRCQ